MLKNLWFDFEDGKQNKQIQKHGKILGKNASLFAEYHMNFKLPAHNTFPSNSNRKFQMYKPTLCESQKQKTPSNNNYNKEDVIPVF